MRAVLAFLAGIFVVQLSPAVAQESGQPTKVGVTAAADPNTRGTPPARTTRNLFIGTNVYFEERVQTSKVGKAQLVFVDESALTVSPNADLVLDRFVYDPKRSAGELAMSVGRGLFRFVGGRISKKKEVTFKTPVATIGIRGGIVVLDVKENGRALAIFLFGQQMTITNKSGVRRVVTRPGFAVDITSATSEPSSPYKVSGEVLVGYLRSLEGTAGQAAGSSNPPQDQQVAASGLPAIGSGNEPKDVPIETAALGPSTGGTPAPPPDPLTEPHDVIQADLDLISDPAGQSPSVPATLFNSSFSGSFISIFNTDPPATLPLTNLHIENPLVGTGPGGEDLRLPVSGPAVPAPEGFTGFEIDLSPGSGFILPDGSHADEGAGYLSDDETFLYYDLGEFHEAFALISTLFVGIPATTAPQDGVTTYLLEPHIGHGWDIPFIRSGRIPTPGTPTMSVDWGNGYYGGGYVFIENISTPGGSGQRSAASVYTGTVDLSGGMANAELAGTVHGSELSTFNSVSSDFIFQSTNTGEIELARDGSGNALFGSSNPDYFVMVSDGPVTEDFIDSGGGQGEFYPVVVAHAAAENDLGSRTTANLQGFTGGALTSSGTLNETVTFSGTWQMSTDAANGTVSAVATIGEVSDAIFGRALIGALRPRVTSVDFTAQFGGPGASIFADDDRFAAIETSPNSAQIAGTPVDSTALYMVSSSALQATNILPDGVSFCECNYVRWGFWGGDIFVGTDGIHTHLATWVAGDMSDKVDLPAMGIAHHAGHAIGTVVTPVSMYQAVGGFNQSFNFATGSGNFQITDFDGQNYAGAINFSGGGQAVYSGGSVDVGIDRAISVTGAFMSGGGDPAAEVGGSFSITTASGSPDYGASGIFAGTRTAAP